MKYELQEAWVPIAEPPDDTAAISTWLIKISVDSKNDQST